MVIGGRIDGCGNCCWWTRRFYNNGIREIFMILHIASLFLVISSTPSSNFHSSFDNTSICSQSFLSSCRCYFNDTKSVIDCSAHSLTTWPSFIYQQNSTLFTVEILNLSRNDLKQIDFDGVTALGRLKILDISYNTRLNIDDEAEWPFLNLEALFLQTCGLVSVPSLTGLKSLLHLDLRSNRIGFISARNFGSVEKTLRILDISRNAVVSLPSDLFPSNCSLRILNLSQNQLGTLQKHNFRNLSNLEALNISHNSIRRLPKDIFSPLIRLKELDLGHNRFRRLEALSFKGLKELRTLSLERNRLISLADGTFWDVPQLTRLTLAQNRLTSVDRGWVYGLEALTELNLSKNALFRLDSEAWQFCQRLQILDLSGNGLATLRPRAFHHLRQLRRLNLRENHITLIYANAFESLHELGTLDLSGNLLADVLNSGQQIFISLSNLRILRLASNEIRVLPNGVFDGLVSLTTLDLSQNPLAVFPANSLPMPSVLKLVIMNTSSLLCDCQLTWLLDYGHMVNSRLHNDMEMEHGSNRILSGVAECRHPEEWSGKSLSQLPSNVSCGNVPHPVLVTNPKSTTGLRGHNVTFQCAARCQEDYVDCHMTIRWRKNGRLLYDEPDSGLAVVSQWDGTGNGRWWSELTIEAVEDSDGGWYQCQFANELASVVSEKAQLVVFVPPTLIKKPVDSAVRVGGTVRLECAATGNPAPTLSWRKDNDGDEFPAARERRMHLMPTDDVFFIVDVKLQDAGMYTCVARSAAGEDRAQAQLNVYNFPDNEEGSTIPEITVRVGATAILECTTSAEPGSSVGEAEEPQWFRDGVSLVSSPKSHPSRDGNVWIINEASVSDQGMYKCRASPVERSWRLTVTGASDNAAKLGPVRSPDLSMDWKENSDSSTQLPSANGPLHSFFDPTGMPGVLVLVGIVCVVLTSLGWVSMIVWRRRKLGSPLGVATVVVSVHEKSAVTAALVAADEEQLRSIPNGRKRADPTVQLATVTF